MEKEVNVKIIDYDYFGRGISKEEGTVCFVPKVRVGFEGKCTLVRTTKNYRILRCKKEEMEKTDCPFFYACGGCQLRHLSYQEELAFKVKKVKELFLRNAKISLEDVPILKTKEDGYRNKAVFHLEQGKVGYYEEESHNILEITSCSLLPKAINLVLEDLRAFAKENKNPMTAVVRSFQNKTMLSLTGPDEKTKDLSSSFPHVDTLYYQGKLQKGDAYLTVSLLGVDFQISALSFFQVSLVGMEVLYRKILAYLKKVHAKKVIDLYCGVGSISLVVAKKVKEVFGVEVIPDAILDAKENALRNGIQNVSFLSARVEDVLEKLPKDYDTLLLDPPRKGLDKKTRNFLLQKKYPNLVYVSCDPATLTRDIMELKTIYTLEEITLVDMFPKTYHVECVCLLKIRKSLTKQ